MAASEDRQDCYVGNSAYNNALERYAPFPTRSDAMIASLALSCGASPDTMDTVFRIIQDSSFDPSEMTMRRTEDIYIHASKHSPPNNTADPSNIISRISGRLNDGMDARVSAVSSPAAPAALEEVVSWIDDAIEDRDMSEKERRALRKTLRSLTLVQTHLTHAAQRALGRWVFHRSGKREVLLWSCLTNPYYGPWTRCFLFSPDTSLPRSPDISATVKTLSIAFAEKLTGLRKFVWSLDSAALPMDLFEDTLASLSSATELVLDADRYSKGQKLTASHYRSINSMPSLKNLTLSGWEVSEIPCQGLPPELTQHRPSPSLQALELDNPRLQFKSKLNNDGSLRLVWTRGVSGDFFLSTILLSFYWERPGDKDDDVVFERCRDMLPLLRRLDMLYIETLAPGKQHRLLWFLDRCPKTLSRLFIQLEETPSEALLRGIPRSVKELFLEFGGGRILDSPADREDIDALLHRFISADAWPELCTLRIYFARSQGPSPDAPVIQFTLLDRVKASCGERHVDFVVSVYSLGSFFHGEVVRTHINEVMKHLDILHVFRDRQLF